MITFRVYQVDKDTGERTELRVEEYEPGPGRGGSLPLAGAFALPPCTCPRCRQPAAEKAP